MYNLVPILMFTLFVGVGTLLTTTIKDQRSFLDLYRKKINPPYPIMPKELRDEIHKPQVNRLMAIRMLAISTPRRLNLYWSKYPKYPELDALSSSIRTKLMLSIALFVCGLAIITGLSYKLAH